MTQYGTDDRGYGHKDTASILDGIVYESLDKAIKGECCNAFLGVDIDDIDIREIEGICGIIKDTLCLYVDSIFAKYRVVMEAWRKGGPMLQKIDEVYEPIDAALKERYGKADNR